MQVSLFQWKVDKNFQAFDSRLSSLLKLGAEAGLKPSIYGTLGDILSGPTLKEQEVRQERERERVFAQRASEGGPAAPTVKTIQYRCDGCQLYPIRGESVRGAKRRVKEAVLFDIGVHGQYFRA